MPITQRDPKLAPLGRRLAAGAIDASCGVGGGTAFIGGVAIWVKLRDGDVSDGLEGAMERFPEFAESLSWARAEPVLAFTTAVSRRNWRSVGMYLMHIRRAELHTGGPVTVRRALIRHLAGWGVSRLVSRRAVLPWLERHQERLTAVNKDADAARARHPDDRLAQQQAIMRVYRDARVNPTSSCWMPLLPTIVIWVVTLFTPWHQSPADWLAGVVTVRD